MPNKNNCFLLLIALPDEDQKRPEVIYNLCAGCTALWFYAVGESNQLKLKHFDCESKEKNEFYSFKEVSNKNTLANGIRSFKIQIKEGVGRFTITSFPGLSVFQGFNDFQEIVDVFNSMNFGAKIKFNIDSVEQICKIADPQSYRIIKFMAR